MDENDRFEIVDRRRLLSRLGAVAAGGVAVVAADAVFAGDADATVGAMQFGTGNNAGTAATDLTSTSTGATLRLHNQGSGKALYGESLANTAIWGESGGGTGVTGVALTPAGTDGVFGASHDATASGGAGVHGHHYTGDNPAVLGTIGARTGLIGPVPCIMGDSETNPGVAGLSTNSVGVLGDSLTSYGGQFGGGTAGVVGEVRGGGDGVLGSAGGPNGKGVHGTAAGSGGVGVLGESDHSSGVVGVPSARSGFAAPRAGVLGDSRDTAGVAGLSKNYIGVIGSGDVEAGVAGQSNSSDGVRGTSKTASGVSGTSISGAGVTGTATGQGVGVHAVANGTGAVGLLASVESGVTGASALGVQGAALFTGPNTLAGTTKLTGPTHVSGAATFTGTVSLARSGTVTITAGHRSATHSSIALTADSLAIATIQSGPTTNAVAAATPNVSGSSITITLQKNATAATKVAFVVIG